MLHFRGCYVTRNCGFNTGQSIKQPLSFDTRQFSRSNPQPTHPPHYYVCWCPQARCLGGGGGWGLVGHHLWSRAPGQESAAGCLLSPATRSSGCWTRQLGTPTWPPPSYSLSTLYTTLHYTLHTLHYTIHYTIHYTLHKVQSTMWQCPNLAPEEMQLGSAGWGWAVVFSNRDIDIDTHNIRSSEKALN